MKNFILSTLLLTTLFLTSKTAKAQPSLISNKIFAKTTDTKSRIIAFANYDYSAKYIIQDSTRFQWSGTMSQDQYNTVYPFFSFDKAMINDYYLFKSDTIAGITKTMRVYDASENLTFRIEFRWDNVAGVWDTFNVINYVYIGGKLIQDEMRQKVFTTPTAIVTRNKNFYTYKAGLLDEKISYTSISFFSSKLKPESKTNYTYAGGVIASVVVARWDSSAIVSPAYYNNSRLLLKFSGKDTIQKTIQAWDTGTKDWRNIERMSYDFSKGKYSEDLTENWDKATSSWKYVQCDSLIYVSGVLTYQIRYNWNASSKIWSPILVNQFSFVGSNLDKLYVPTWDGSKWADNFLLQYTYDAKNNLTSRSTYYWDGSSYSIPSAFESRTNYYWEDYNTTSIQENGVITTKAKLYPNPAVNNHSYLDYFTDKNVATEVQVVDMMGREVLHTKEAAYIGDHSVLLQLDNIASGVYIVNLICEGKQEAQLKLIK